MVANGFENGVVLRKGMIRPAGNQNGTGVVLAHPRFERLGDLNRQAVWTLFHNLVMKHLIVLRFWQKIQSE